MGWVSLALLDVSSCPTAAVQVHREDLLVAVTVTREREPRSVRRPRGITVKRAVIRDLDLGAAVRVHDPDLGIAVAVALERDPAGRPGTRSPPRLRPCCE